MKAACSPGSTLETCALVYVAVVARVTGSFQPHFLQHAVFNQRDPGFRGCRINQNFFAHERVALIKLTLEYHFGAFQ